jgi:hypothetical protein
LTTYTRPAPLDVARISIRCLIRPRLSRAEHRRIVESPRSDSALLPSYARAISTPRRPASWTPRTYTWAPRTRTELPTHSLAAVEQPSLRILRRDHLTPLARTAVAPLSHLSSFEVFRASAGHPAMTAWLPRLARWAHPLIVSPTSWLR